MQGQIAQATPLSQLFMYMSAHTLEITIFEMLLLGNLEESGTNNSRNES